MTEPRSTIPIVSVVGRSDSGKTTFLEKLIHELAERGVTVATAKHHAHECDIDTPGKDSWRHARAGAVTTMVSSPRQFGVIRKMEREYSLLDMSRIAGELGSDILLTEGFKYEGINRIEVSRKVRSDDLICTPNEMLALVTDNDEIACPGVPRFGLDDAVGVADLIEARFLAAFRGAILDGD